MSEEKKKLKITFAPGSLDNFDGTQEELDEFIKTLLEHIESGEFFENAVNIEDIDELELDGITFEEPSPKKLH
jgi:hypothetical protein